ncbi:2-methylaconitate cis-trans isomerase PrpF family protein [Paraburkholderia fungorum]|uniref:PrpF protein n=1 Tax=Paraburkholderia fungorum TaxID=134537 RepID=A0A3R7HCC0_9BURK|nr:PrpF domain-containing protein [Paraburkholderia fungorum]RKF33368.1 PrpF protein [Paraburkholderia fungorum]
MDSTGKREQFSVPCTIMRAGTSKGVFFHEKDIPPPGQARDTLLKRVMGCQDVLQIDGLGGSRLVTAKIAIVKPSEREDADVDYTYAIVPPERDVVVYTSNCGNISSGVGPFAIDAGLVRVMEPITTVRIFNTNTKKILVAHVPVVDGQARIEGDFAIPGVPGTGAEIMMDYRQTLGAKTGRILPTGNATDMITLEDGWAIEVTIGDVANPCVFIRARDLGMTGTEGPESINNNEALLVTLDEIRARAAQTIGLCDDWKEADKTTPALPLVVMVADPASYTTLNGAAVDPISMDLLARLVFYRKCHESMAGTGSMCTAAMSRIPGTLVNQSAVRPQQDTLRIGHPSGVMIVNVAARIVPDGQGVVYDKLGFSRTARRIMEGHVFVRSAGMEMS